MTHFIRSADPFGEVAYRRMRSKLDQQGLRPAHYRVADMQERDRDNYACGRIGFDNGSPMYGDAATLTQDRWSAKKSALTRMALFALIGKGEAT